eukprot:98074-Amphidinium_carterae.1
MESKTCFPASNCPSRTVVQQAMQGAGLLHGVSEADRRGNDRADKAANNVLAAVDGRQAKWIRFRAFA